MGPALGVKALDTNIVLRLILNDEPDQVQAATALLADPVFVGIGVLMETAWVLRSVYRQPRSAIAIALSELLNIPTVVISDETSVRWAIERYRDHKADIADVLHIVAARGATAFVSFEKHLVKQAGADAPLPIERLR